MSQASASSLAHRPCDLTLACRIYVCLKRLSVLRWSSRICVSPSRASENPELIISILHENEGRNLYKTTKQIIRTIRTTGTTMLGFAL